MELHELMSKPIMKMMVRSITSKKKITYSTVMSRWAMFKIILNIKLGIDITLYTYK